jgi:tetratricopeptide (TPR) repeat protein
MQFSASGIGPWLDDISYLQQNLWLNDIARRAIREPTPARWQPWLKEIESSVGIPEAEQLANAERLLDWVARNIQLDAMPSMPNEPLASAGQGEVALPAERGELGPGYGHLPLETLLYGHGDAQERARIFILLCRHVGIDAVILGFQDEQSAARRGWTTATLVGGKLYLFETGLGLPVPGAEGKGIATLDQVVKDPTLLRQLDVAGLPPYPVSDKDLKQGAIPMIDAEPAALSRRMQLLQAAMPTATRLALATQPSETAAALRKTNLFSSVQLWDVPFKAVLYRIGVAQRAMQDQKFALEQHRLSVRFAPSRPLIRARNFHLQGRFENEDQKKAARSLYLDCRPPDREIDALKTNEFYRKTIGLDQTLPEDPVQKDATLDMFTGVAREGKFDATYWLALTYFEAGKPEETIRWLVKPVVEVSPPSPWLPGARYNLGRCYEQLGQYDLARQWLESDKDSPQRAGNLLRAKMLARERPAASDQAAK